MANGETLYVEWLHKNLNNEFTNDLYLWINGNPTNNYIQNSISIWFVRIDGEHKKTFSSLVDAKKYMLNHVDLNIKFKYTIKLGRQVGTNSFDFITVRSYNDCIAFYLQLNVLKSQFNVMDLLDRVEESTNSGHRTAYIILKDHEE